MNLLTRIKTSLLWIVILLPFTSFGQSMAPLGTLPMQFNSSFAGSNGGPRISAFTSYERHKTQSNIDRNSIYSFYTSFDQFIPFLRSGIGITAGLTGQNTSANGGNTTYKPHWASVSLALAPKFSKKGKYTFSPSISFTFSKAWNQSYGMYMDSVWIITNANNFNFSSSAGILFNTSKFYIGYSMKLLSKTVYHDISNLALRGAGYYFYSFLQTGYTFGRRTSKFSFTPQLVFRINNYPSDKRLRIGLGLINFTFRYNKFLWGLNSGGIHLGWQNENFRFIFTNNLGFLPKRDNLYISNSVSIAFRYLIPSDIQNNYTIRGQ
jgi:hypothetical protein